MEFLLGLLGLLSGDFVLLIDETFNVFLGLVNSIGLGRDVESMVLVLIGFITLLYFLIN